MIKQLIENIPNQIRRAVEIGKNISFTRSQKPIQNIVIAGLGGSGIAGNILENLAYSHLAQPITVCKTYQLPAFVNENTLLIISSFSGNTEETLSALHEGLAKKAKIFCQTSGGEIAQIAQKQALDHVLLPVEAPCPRQHLAYSLVQLFFVLKGYGLWQVDFEQSLQEFLSIIDKENLQILAQAQEIAKYFFQKIPLVYGDNSLLGILTRFQQQINENAKQFCHINIFPEMNHNELVGWGLPASYYQNFAVLYMRTPAEHPQVSRRFEICRPIFEQKAPVLVVYPKGSEAICQTFYYLYLTDWVSWFLSELNQVDAFEINVINFLKNELAKNA